MDVKLGVSKWVASEEDVDLLKEFVAYDAKVQVAFHTRELAEKWFSSFLDVPRGAISSIHLPKGLLPQDYMDGGLVDTLVEAFDVRSVVVHPWCNELDEIVDIVKRKQKYTLNLEVFCWKDLNGKASPFTLIEKYGKDMRDEWIGLCMDFSHLLSEMITFSFFKALLPYTKMYHISGRKGDSQHLPFLRKDLDVAVQPILTRLLEQKRIPEYWILEYMPEYYIDLKKHYFLLRETVNSKRRKYGDL